MSSLGRVTPTTVKGVQNLAAALAVISKKEDEVTLETMVTYLLKKILE